MLSLLGFLLQDGWNTEPFSLVEKEGKLYGRGSTDDKGPVIAWLNVIETMQELGVELPVNLKVGLLFLRLGLESC